MIARKPLPTARQGKQSLDSEPEMTKAARILGISTESPDYALTRPKTGDPQYGRNYNFASHFPESFHAQEDADAELSDGSNFEVEPDPKTPTHGLTAMPKSKSKFLSWQRKSGSSSKSKSSTKQSFSSRWRSSGEKQEQRPQTAAPSTEKQRSRIVPSSSDGLLHATRGAVHTSSHPLPSFPTSPPLPSGLMDKSPSLSMQSASSSDKPLPPLPVPVSRELRLSSFSVPLPDLGETKGHPAQREVQITETPRIASQAPSIASLTKSASGVSDMKNSRLSKDPSAVAPRRTPTEKTIVDHIGNGLGLMHEPLKTVAQEKKIEASDATAAKRASIVAADFPAVPRHSTSTRAKSERSHSSEMSVRASSSVESISESEAQTSRTSGTGEQICTAKAIRVTSISGPSRPGPLSQRTMSVDIDRRSSAGSWARHSTMTKRSVSSTMTTSDLTKQSVLSLSSDSERSSLDEPPYHVEQILEEEETPTLQPQPTRRPSEGSNFSRKLYSRRGSNRTLQRESLASVSTGLTIPSLVPSVPQLALVNLEPQQAAQSEAPDADRLAAPYAQPLPSPSSSVSTGKVMMLSKREIALINALREEKARLAATAATGFQADRETQPAPLPIEAAVTDLVHEVVLEPVSEPAIEPASELVTEPFPEFVTEAAPEVATEAASETVTEVAPEVLTEAASEVVSEADPEIVTEAAPEVVMEAVAGDITEATSEVATDPALDETAVELLAEQSCEAEEIRPDSFRYSSGGVSPRTQDIVSWKLPELSFGPNSRSSRSSFDFRLSLNFGNRASLPPNESLSQQLKSVPESSSVCPHLEESLPTPPTSRCSPLTPTLAHQVMSTFVLPLNIQERPSSSEVVMQSRPSPGHSRRRTASSDCLFLDAEPAELGTPESHYMSGRRGWTKDLWSGIDELDLIG